MSDTIFALSSGRPPAAIAIVRISGPSARDALRRLAGNMPRDRVASVRTLRDAYGGKLDRSLVIFFPGPTTATGEDLAELHLHGGRAVVAAVERALAACPGLRMAEPGEFTRRALEHGRLDLLQAEGLADLLEAETETQRRVAMSAAEGQVSQALRGWMDRVSIIAARIEAELDFGEEDDVAEQARYDPHQDALALAADLEAALSGPSVERLRDGVVVVLAGPPNAGKSSLFNALLERDAAIVTPIAGTTRDMLEASVVRSGIPFRLVDTAGLVEQTHDVVEGIGVARARDMLARADLVLWMGEPEDGPPGCVRVGGKCDLGVDRSCDIAVSIYHPESVRSLWSVITQRASEIMTIDDGVCLRESQRRLVHSVASELRLVSEATDLLLQAEHVRVASRGLAALLGHDATEVMLDALFGRFCLGK